MSFPQADTAINKQRIVVIARLVGHGHRGGMGKLIARADNEIFKCILGDKLFIPLRPIMLAVAFVPSFNFSLDRFFDGFATCS